MRVALFGNIANSLYRLGVVLRDAGSIDAHLYVDPTDVDTALPESDDPSLAGEYPAWIHAGQWYGARNTLAPWRSPIVDELRNYDLVIVNGSGPVFAQFTGRPWCFLASGGDLTVRPFPLRFLTWYPSWRDRLTALVVGAWQRRGIRRAAEIWAQPFAPMRAALASLHVDGAVVREEYLPFPVDPTVFDPAGDVADDNEQIARLARSDFVVFHPSRLMMRDEPRLRSTGQWKRNDVLIKGYARFVETTNARDPLLAMPDSEMSPDVTLARDLVDELGISSRVLWLKPPQPSGFTRRELIDLYRSADVVGDDFGIGWFGLVALEALSMATPVVSYVDEDAMAALYPWHPICQARDPMDVAARLDALYSDPEQRREVGARGREWVEQFHSPRAVERHYLAAIDGLATRRGLT